jgi:hypothetical protein
LAPNIRFLLQIYSYDFACPVEILATAKSSDERSASLLSDMDHLEIAIAKVQEMLERVSQYVQQVLVRV